MGADLLLRNVRIPGTGPADMRIRAGTIEAISPSTEQAPAGSTPGGWTGPIIDGEGELCLPGLIDGHAHIATTLWGQPWRPHRAGPGLAGLIANQREGRRELAPVVERASALLAAYRDHGTTCVRAHIDVDPEIGLGHVEGALEAAERFAGVIDVELVAFPQLGMLINPGTAELMSAAVDAGVAVVGGIDPAGVDGDAVAALDTIFGLADRTGAGVDIHLHDRGELGRWELGLIVERTVALGLQGRVAVSHAFCLGDGSSDVEQLLEQLSEHRIAIMTVAPEHPTRSRCCACSTSASRCASVPTASATCGRRGATPTSCTGPGCWPGAPGSDGTSRSRPRSPRPRPSAPGHWGASATASRWATVPIWCWFPRRS